MREKVLRMWRAAAGVAGHLRFQATRHRGGLLVFILATDALSYLFPALNVDGDASYSVGDMAVEVISLILTTIVVIADRAARSTTG